MFWEELNNPNKSILFCCDAVDAFRLAVVFESVVNLVSIEPVYVWNELVLSFVAIELIKEPVADANSVWLTYVTSNEDVKFSKELNLLFWVVFVVSFEAVYEFNELNIPTTCDEPETVPTGSNGVIWLEPLTIPLPFVSYDDVAFINDAVTFANVVNFVSIEPV